MYLRARRRQPRGDVNFWRRRLAHTIVEATSRLDQNTAYGEIAHDLRHQVQILEMIDFSFAMERTQWVPLPVSGRPVGNLLNQSGRQERAILRKLAPGDPVAMNIAASFFWMRTSSPPIDVTNRFPFTFTAT